jgi:hypothetical protein
MTNSIKSVIFLKLDTQQTFSITKRSIADFNQKLFSFEESERLLQKILSMLSEKTLIRFVDASIPFSVLQSIILQTMMSRINFRHSFSTFSNRLITTLGIYSTTRYHNILFVKFYSIIRFLPTSTYSIDIHQH